MSLANCKRDFSTRPPSVVARSVIRNELIPVLEWFIGGKPGQLAHVRRYAEKAQGLLAKDGIAFPACAGWLAGTTTANDLLAECRRLHADLREAEQAWAAGGEEALEKKRAHGRRQGERGKAALEKHRQKIKRGTSEAFEAADPTRDTPGLSDAREGPQTPLSGIQGSAA